MPTLAQILAIEKGTKTNAHRDLTALYQKLDKAPLFSGLIKTYAPKDEEGERQPNQSQKVQMTVAQVLETITTTLTDLFDITATKDVCNTGAFADVAVDGVTLLAQVPVTYLLFLEKQLKDLHDVARKLPTLDPSETWTENAAQGYFESADSVTTSTKKLPRTLEKSPATDKHPAQVEVWYEDTPVGTWTTRKLSGAMEPHAQRELLSRIETLQQAVKYAREQANTNPVTKQEVGKEIFSYLFGA